MSLPREVQTGEFVPVKIGGALTYDLTGLAELKQEQVITLEG